MLPLYPVSASISYPSAKEVLTFLTKSKITETQFTEEHVEMLLNVLVLDGDIERVRRRFRCGCIYLIYMGTAPCLWRLHVGGRRRRRI